MANTKLSDLPSSSTVDVVYGELSGVSKKITPANIVAQGGGVSNILQQQMIGTVNVDYHVSGDNGISIDLTNYIVTGVWTANNVGGTGSYEAGLFTAPAGGGTNLLNDSGAPGNENDLIGFANLLIGGINVADSFIVLTEATLYYRIITPEVGAATGTIYIIGIDISDL